MGYVAIRQSLFTRNAGGGISFHGLQMFLSQTAIAQNQGVGGLYIPYNNVGARNITIFDNQFDSNTPQHIRVDAGLGVMITGNEFVHQTSTPPGSYAPTTGILLGDGVNALTGVTLTNNIVRSSPTNPPVATTWLSVNNTATDSIMAVNTLFSAFSGANALPYADPAGKACILDGNGWLRCRQKHLRTDTAGGGTYTPNTLSATHHFVVYSTSSASVIGAPTSNIDGQELIIELFNNSGSPIAITWNAVYVNQPPLTLRASQYAIARFIFSGSNWIRQGGAGVESQLTNTTSWTPGGAIAANSVTTFTITLTGATPTLCSATASPQASLGGNFVWSAEVIANDTVTVVVANVGAGSATPATVTWRGDAFCH
jgi:hypothetical protein